MGILDGFLNKVTDDSNDENLEKAEDEKTSPGA
jgi:hypothetical protein